MRPCACHPQSVFGEQTVIARGVLTVLLLISGGALAHEGHDPTPRVRKPLLMNPQAVAGNRVYDSKCARCHGASLEGTDKGPSLLPYDPAHHPDRHFRDAVRNGVRQHHWNLGDMPPIAGVSDEEVENVIRYIREVQAFNTSPNQ